MSDKKSFHFTKTLYYCKAVFYDHPLGTRRCYDVESTSLTLIQRRSNVVCPLGTVDFHCSSDRHLVSSQRFIWCWWYDPTSFSKPPDALEMLKSGHCEGIGTSTKISMHGLKFLPMLRRQELSAIYRRTAPSSRRTFGEVRLEISFLIGRRYYNPLKVF